MADAGLFGIGFHRREGLEGLAAWLGLPPEEVRERLAAFRALGMREGVVLSTCERLEIYGVGPLEEAVAFLRRSLPGRFPVLWVGRAVAVHLFRVAAGLDSTAVGETEILGQIRSALAIAREVGAAGPILGPLLERALALGRAVRARTELGRLPVSLATLAVQEVHRRISLEGKRVLVAGAGTMGTQIAHALLRYRPAPIRVLSRTPERARALAEQVGGEAGTLMNLTADLIRVDVAFLALATPRPILSAPDLQGIIAARGGAPLWLVDLGAPPNVGLDGPLTPGVHCIRLEDLQALNARYRERMAEAIARAEEMVAEAVREWERWWRGRQVGPVIAQLQRRADALRRQELEWLWPKLGELTPTQRARIEQFAHRLVQKLLHLQMMGLKGMAEDPYAFQRLRVLWEWEKEGDGGGPIPPAWGES
ncbi:glutamyl-tRNA reductase [Thermoflexus sp.]|uniref:glutamyl-tRNA reductase n=1 Tax=Thermoflexus sp. TaxID=1969742 RepID=UPI001769E965|nr:glutamyl-tRNA reductase [Thermoflexus sp.]